MLVLLSYLALIAVPFEEQFIYDLIGVKNRFENVSFHDFLLLLVLMIFASSCFTSNHAITLIYQNKSGQKLGIS